MATLNLQVGTETDDCHRRLATSDFTLTSNYCSLGDYDATYYDYFSAARFLSVTIGQGDTIDAAVMQLRANGLVGVVPTIAVKGEDADDAATFLDAADYDARDRTTATADWTPEAWVSDTWYTSSELKTIVQEIVDRGSWASGNALVIFCEHVLGWGGTQARIRADSYDAAAGDAPKLDIDYTGAAVTTRRYSLPLMGVG